MPSRRDEIERLAALALAPLVEVAWADGLVTAAERQGVLEAAKAIGLEQHSDELAEALAGLDPKD